MLDHCMNEVIAELVAGALRVFRSWDHLSRYYPGDTPDHTRQLDPIDMQALRSAAQDTRLVVETGNCGPRDPGGLWFGFPKG